MLVGFLKCGEVLVWELGSLVIIIGLSVVVVVRSCWLFCSLVLFMVGSRVVWEGGGFEVIW